MSEEAVTVIRNALDAWNRGDYDAWLALWDADAEFYPLRAQLEGRAYRGHDGLRRFVAEVREEWDKQPLFELSLRDAGEHVLGTGRISARGRASGADLDVPLGMVATVQRDRIVSARFFSDPADATAAAGLEE